MQLPCNGQNWGSNTPWILGRMSCWRTRTGDGGTPPYGGDGDGGDAGAATWRSLEAVSRETRTERERGASNSNLGLFFSALRGKLDL